MRNCWASTTENLRDDDADGFDDDSGKVYSDSVDESVQTFRFFNDKCPLYSWIGPSYGYNIGEINPQAAESSDYVTLRQFSFTSDLATSTGLFYHCEVSL